VTNDLALFVEPRRFGRGPARGVEVNADGIEQRRTAAQLARRLL
jgi:hypothetical protein